MLPSPDKNNLKYFQKAVLNRSDSAAELGCELSAIVVAELFTCFSSDRS